MRPFLSGFTKTMVAVAAASTLSAAAVVPAGAAETAYPERSFVLGDSYIGARGTMIFYNRVVGITGRIDAYDERELGLRSCKYFKFMSSTGDIAYTPMVCGKNEPFEIHLPANVPGGATKVMAWMYHHDTDKTIVVDQDTIYR
ncbi:hypothetical protein [Kribbella deserti]|uniref:Uncharacterized protein n=1 Tax=Kribbella deserti TaxID=1926257 RepID=A0ABV6QEW9_9ACTN